MKNTKTITASFKEVFKRPSYVILFLTIALTFFVASLWLIRYDLVAIFDGVGKIKLLWSLILDWRSTFTVSSLSLVIILSVLTAMHISMTIFYVKRRVILQKKVGVGFFGMLIGFLGVGCASCGSLILSSIFGLSATAAFIGILPFKGLEFGILGVIILLTAIYLVAKKIQNPLLCKIDY